MDAERLVALVPGASRPVGRSIARRFGAAGAALILPVFSDWPESTDEMEAEFRDSGYRFHTCSCDLRNPADVAELCRFVTVEHGSLQVLINNIERGGMPVVHGAYEHEVNRDQWRLEMETTLQAKQLLFRHALPLLSASGGSVVNITSIAGQIGRSGPASLLFSEGYCAANRAVGTFTEQWAREGAPSIRVNEVMLGIIDGRHGAGTRGWKLLSDSQQREVLAHTLLQRAGTPEEVAELVYFVAVQARFLTGAIIRADGGYCLGGEPVMPMPPGVLSS